MSAARLTALRAEYAALSAKDDGDLSEPEWRKLRLEMQRVFEEIVALEEPPCVRLGYLVGSEIEGE